MNSNQRSQGNNQSDNAGNEKSVSSSRAGTVQDNTQNRNSKQSGSAGSQTGSPQQQDRSQQQGGSPGSQQSTDRTGSQTGTGQKNAMPGVHESNDLAGGMPRSPGARHLAADEKMDDDTGLSNKGNRQSAEIDEGTRQPQQSNVGRRSDGTPD